MKASKYHYLYDKALWKRIRKQHLQLNPLCVFCERKGEVTAATICDHIEPHKGDEDKFFDTNNLQSLCKLCHDSDKQRIEQGKGVKGADINGLPLDGEHHWHI